jgi:hypothetical protein
MICVRSVNSHLTERCMQVHDAPESIPFWHWLRVWKHRCFCSLQRSRQMKAREREVQSYRNLLYFEMFCQVILSTGWPYAQAWLQSRHDALHMQLHIFHALSSE